MAVVSVVAAVPVVRVAAVVAVARTVGNSMGPYTQVLGAQDISWGHT